ncbi:MAG: DUF975 family protein [Oscillospiraceae bacterium]|nr:DUF975 family protein [Oscillospiraceae bacterium]
MNRTQLKRRARHAYMDTKRLYLTTFIYVLIVFLLNYVAGRMNGILAQWGSNAIKLIEAGKIAPLYTQKEWTAFLFAVLIDIILQIVGVGFISYTLNISRHNPTGIADLADGFSVTFKVFAIALMQGIFIALWSLLFIVPGIIAMYRYRMAYYILLDDPDKGPLQCIRESKELMRGHKKELFVLDLSFIGWEFLITISAGILGIWILPYIYTTYAMYYNDLAYPDGSFPLPVVDEE